MPTPKPPTLAQIAQAIAAELSVLMPGYAKRGKGVCGEVVG